MLIVIGCGNPARSDDGAGVEVVHRLLARLGANNDTLRLIDAGTSGMDVMYQVRGAKRVIIVDSCRSGSEPGAVFRLPASEAQTRGEHGFSLHGLRWDHALYAGSRMFGEDFLRDTEVFLIEAQSLDFGIGLSAAVEQAVERVIGEIEIVVKARVAEACGDVWLQRGRLHLSSAAYERYLQGCPAVALLVRDADWLLLPLRAGAGGLQVKLRNARGDRVIEAQGFFRTQGREDSERIEPLRLHDDPDRGALRIEFARDQASLSR
jgi:hydrogenase maturation protease